LGKLTALSVKNAKPGRHGDGLGLYLLVKPSGARSWLLRVQRDGKRRDIGLGSLAARSLAEAREKAAELRKHALNGRDPIHERDRDRRAAPTFREAAIAAHGALKAGWAEKNAAAFLSSLEEHAFPKLGDLRVDTIEASHMRDMLEPIWLKLPVMARKVRQRAGTVLAFSKSKGWRQAEAPGRSVTVGLPRQPQGGNFDSMPYADVPAFVAGLQAKAETNGRLALLFMILTAARPGEVRSARWAHINPAKGEWNRPADLMKGRAAHTVTLNAPAVALLTRLKEERSPFAEELLFPGQRGKPMSDMTLSKVLKDAKLSVDPHGFRSSFRDWAAEKMSHIPDPVAEAALAHVVPDKVVRAYKRTKFMEMRRELLDAWGVFLDAAVA
jgi:integrase